MPAHRRRGGADAAREAARALRPLAEELDDGSAGAGQRERVEHRLGARRPVGCHATILVDEHNYCQVRLTISRPSAGVCRSLSAPRQRRPARGDDREALRRPGEHAAHEVDRRRSPRPSAPRRLRPTARRCDRRRRPWSPPPARRVGGRARRAARSSLPARGPRRTRRARARRGGGRLRRDRVLGVERVELTVHDALLGEWTESASMSTTPYRTASCRPRHDRGCVATRDRDAKRGGPRARQRERPRHRAGSDGEPRGLQDCRGRSAT